MVSGEIRRLEPVIKAAIDSIPDHENRNPTLFIGRINPQEPFTVGQMVLIAPIHRCHLFLPGSHLPTPVYPSGCRPQEAGNLFDTVIMADGLVPLLDEPEVEG